MTGITITVVDNPNNIIVQDNPIVINIIEGIGATGPSGAMGLPGTGTVNLNGYITTGDSDLRYLSINSGNLFVDRVNNQNISGNKKFFDDILLQDNNFYHNSINSSNNRLEHSIIISDTDTISGISLLSQEDTSSILFFGAFKNNSSNNLLKYYPCSFVTITADNAHNETLDPGRGSVFHIESDGGTGNIFHSDDMGFLVSKVNNSFNNITNISSSTAAWIYYLISNNNIINSTDSVPREANTIGLSFYKADNNSIFLSGGGTAIFGSFDRVTGLSINLGKGAFFGGHFNSSNNNISYNIGDGEFYWGNNLDRQLKIESDGTIEQMVFEDISGEYSDFFEGIAVGYISGNSNYIGGLLDSNGRVSNDWMSRTLNDNNGTQSISYDIRVLRDSIQNYSIEWGNRFLRNSNQDYVLDWNNRILSGNWLLNNNNILTTLDSGNLQNQINKIALISGNYNGNYPNVLIIHSNGTYTGFYGSTNLERGIALTGAIAQSYNGDLIRIGPGTFDFGNLYNPVTEDSASIHIPSGVSLIGEGINNTIITSNILDQIFLCDGNNLIQSVSILNTSNAGGCIVFSSINKNVKYTTKDVYVSGLLDCLGTDSFLMDSEIIIENTRCIGMDDTFNGTASKIYINNSHFTLLEDGIGRVISFQPINNTGKLIARNSIFEHNTRTISQNAILFNANNTSSLLQLEGCFITNLGSGDLTYIRNNGSGILKVDSSTVYDSTKTFGTITTLPIFGDSGKLLTSIDSGNLLNIINAKIALLSGFMVSGSKDYGFLP